MSFCCLINIHDTESSSATVTLRLNARTQNTVTHPVFFHNNCVYKDTQRFTCILTPGPGPYGLTIPILEIAHPAM